jgi:transposase-like protein
MNWPNTPIESQDDFRPTYCPRRSCSSHHHTGPGYRFVRHGYYSTRQQSRIPRFRCKTCVKTFSRQTFATSYYLKRRALLPQIAAGIVAGSAHRQIARSLSSAPTTVARQAARLGRHAILLHARALDALRGQVDEPFVFDHFETFEFTQDCPFGVGTLVGRKTWFVYGVDPAPHARTGRRTTAQKARIALRPKRHTYGGYVGSTLRSLDVMSRVSCSDGSIHLDGDGNAAYAAAVRRHVLKERIVLGRYPNPRRGPKGSPRSAEAIARDDVMFAVDLLHKLVRHSCAHHRRETIAFARRLNAAMERFFLLAIWRNFVKRRSERKPKRETPASRLGLSEGPWTWRRVLARRLFHARQPIPEMWDVLYRRRWETPVLASNAVHSLVRAF